LGLRPVARSRVVLIGTSAGGLATVLAAARLPGVAGWIGLDPVDRTGSGTGAAAQLTAPAVVMLADASACNLFGSGRSSARAAPHLLRTIVVDGASHCDFEDPTNNMCRALCGASTPAMQSVIRADVAINQKARPLFFTSRKAKDAIDACLAERVRRGFGTSEHAEYRGLDPQSRLFLTEAGEPFAIVSYGGDGGMRFLCRGIHETYRKIFRRIGLAGVSALMIRRTVASRLSDRGAAHEQIGQVLGIGRKRGVRKLIPKVGTSLPSMLRELI